MGLLLCWLVFCPFGIVLPGLLVNFPLGIFLTGVMNVSWLLMVLLVLGSLKVNGICRVSLPRSVGHAGGSCESRVLVGIKRIRLNRKTPAHLARLGNLESLQSRSRVWKRLRVLGLVGVLFVTLMFFMSVIIVMMGPLWMTGLELGRFLGLHWSTSPGFA